MTKDVYVMMVHGEPKEVFTTEEELISTFKTVVKNHAILKILPSSILDEVDTDLILNKIRTDTMYILKAKLTYELPN